MQYLLGSTQTLTLAALLLVLVGSLPSAPALVGRAARWRVPSLLVAILAGMLLLSLAIRHSPVLHDSLPSRVIRYAAKELELAQEPNVLVVDGGSYVVRAVDTEVLEATLSELGYRVRAIRFAAGAANHFERYHMQLHALRRSQREPDPRQRWIYLTEAQLGYDREPLAQFEENQDTYRAYQYLWPENGWYAARAVSQPDSTPPLSGAWRWPLFRHALINATNTGAFQRLAPEAAVGVHDGLVSEERQRRFKFSGMEPVLEAARQRRAKARVPSWLSQVREPRSRALWQPRLDELVYFGVPTTKPAQMTYVRAFCRSTRAKCLVPSDEGLLGQLDRRAAWRDATHLSRAGAQVYSAWLARALAEAGVLQK
jgi:hypothetical protein